MNDSQKQEIQNLLIAYIDQFPSQAKAALSLKNVAEATVINIKKGNWANISDDMWRNVGKQVGYSNKGAWTMVHTHDFNLLTTIFNDAKEFSNVFAVTAPAGSGKTATSTWYALHNFNAYHIVCAEYYNRKTFLGKILEKLGKDSSGSVAEMMDTIVETLLKQENPILIIDEADKLTDQVLYFFITLYNMLQGKVGIVLLATDFLAKRVNRGRKLNKKGYAEIFSRIGRRFINLKGTSMDEVKKICEANGIENPTAIKTIFEEYEGDLRRVERAVHKFKLKNAA